MSLYTYRNGKIYFSDSVKTCLLQLDVKTPVKRRNCQEWRELLIKLGILDPDEKVIAAAQKFCRNYRYNLKKGQSRSSSISSSIVNSSNNSTILTSVYSSNRLDFQNSCSNSNTQYFNFGNPSSLNFVESNIRAPSNHTFENHYHNQSTYPNFTNSSATINSTNLPNETTYSHQYQTP